MDSVGSGQLAQFNKAGFAWRRIKFDRILVEKITGFNDAALESGEPVELDVSIVVEEWELLDAGTV
jgi:hypothetical protein